MDNFVIRKYKTSSNNEPINIYTDGACSNNGRPDARAGFGIWFKEAILNTSESFTGIQTNNRAELLALLSINNYERRD